MSVNSHLYPDRLFKFVNVRQAHAAKHTDSPVGVPYYAGVPKARITSMYLFPKLEAKKASTTVQNDIVE